MKFVVAVAVFLSVAVSGFAHRLDEYLQATILSVEKDRLQASMRLIPGVAVSSRVLAIIDTNADGVLSQTEQQAYAHQVLRDLVLSLDGDRLSARLVSVAFPQTEDLREGVGEIKISFTAGLPSGGSHRKLTFDNHHQSSISVYLMNSLVPRDKQIEITAQTRNVNQSFYQLSYTWAGVSWWSAVRTSLDNFGAFPSMFRLGMHHIADGTDHLLFLLALLLPAPLLALGSCWGQFASVRLCVLQISKVVTAFTVGHSITLALAALSLVRVPSHTIEILIAVSILISATHALRPLFPGREAGIAACFGLIHGLAFATTLGELGLGLRERVVSILGFNLGIEAMQLMGVIATMPSLVLLSRTNAYSVVRVSGALFGVFASIGWVAERLLGMHSFVDVIVDNVAHHAVWIALGLFLTSLIYWVVEAPRHGSLRTVPPMLAAILVREDEILGLSGVVPVFPIEGHARIAEDELNQISEACLRPNIV